MFWLFNPEVMTGYMHHYKSCIYKLSSILIARLSSIPRDKKFWDIHPNILKHFLSTYVCNALHCKADKNWVATHQIIFYALDNESCEITACTNQNWDKQITLKIKVKKIKKIKNRKIDSKQHIENDSCCSVETMSRGYRKQSLSNGGHLMTNLLNQPLQNLLTYCLHH